MKKGQITIFVIIGLILATLMVLSFIFKESIIEQASKIEITKGLVMSKEARKVQSDVIGCAKNVAELGLVVMGLQGGYTTLDSRVQYTNTQTTINYIPYSGTAYLYFKGQNLVPTKEMMEKQLANFITSNMLICENQYKDLEVSYGKIDTIAKIDDEKIKLDMNFDVKVKKGATESGFKNILVYLPVRLGTIQSVADSIIEKQTETSKEELCISCISRIAAENGIEIGIDKIGEEDVFYSLTDKKSKVADYDYTFMFANKF